MGIRRGVRRAALCAVLSAAAAIPARALPPVPVPAESPVSEPKRVLGKALFWDEQLSSDDTVACGTCHLPERAGADPRPAVHPGESAGTGDDVRGSFGVVRRDASGAAIEDPVFGFGRQVTPRAAPGFFGGLWGSASFWDGRAGGEFRDPLTGEVRIASGGSLESQALAPILSPVEMAREGRTWADVTGKLAGVAPLALASDLPADLDAALSGGAGYPELFQAAFGDPAITPVRIAFALATYERTLVPDQTPWDAFVAGDAAALSASQQQGWAFFQSSACASCHVPPIFTNAGFTNIGVRPIEEDAGRMDVTGDPADAGLFKTPTLRNAGLKPTFMHQGGLDSPAAAVGFYLPTELHFQPNLDPRIPVDIPPAERAPLVDFIANGLTDPRVAARSFPFDRPTLASERPPAIPALPVAWLGWLAAGLLAAGWGAARRRRGPADPGS